MADWSISGLSRLVTWQANTAPAAPAPAPAPAAPAPAAPAGTAVGASIDLAALGVGPIGHGSPAEAVFGCRCSTNPSGLSPQEIIRAQAEALAGQ